MQSRIAVLNAFFKILTKFRLYFFEIQLEVDLFSSRNSDRLLGLEVQKVTHKMNHRNLLLDTLL